MMEEETIRTFYKKWKARLLKWSSLVCAVVFYMYRKTFDYFKYFFFILDIRTGVEPFFRFFNS